MAAQVIVAIENPLDIIVQSAMPYGQRAVLKLALELMPLLEGTILVYSLIRCRHHSVVHVQATG